MCCTQIKVDQRDLLETMCVPREDFLNVSASVYELCFDVVGVEKTKAKAVARKTNTNVMDNHRSVQGTCFSRPMNGKLESILHPKIL